LFQGVKPRVDGAKPTIAIVSFRFSNFFNYSLRFLYNE
jgi:hypothetical protein